MQFSRISKVIFNIILYLQFALPAPYSWGTHHSNYDASLDPIAWSRSFVKDAIRKPRLNKANALEYNSLDDGGEDQYSVNGFKDFMGFRKRRTYRGAFGNTYAKTWQKQRPFFVPKRKYNKSNLQQVMSRRKHKLNARHRYRLL